MAVMDSRNCDAGIHTILLASKAGQALGSAEGSAAGGWRKNNNGRMGGLK
jgi:hypothetical protein